MMASFDTSDEDEEPSASPPAPCRTTGFANNAVHPANETTAPPSNATTAPPAE